MESSKRTIDEVAPDANEVSYPEVPPLAKAIIPEAFIHLDPPYPRNLVETGERAYDPPRNVKEEERDIEEREKFEKKWWKQHYNFYHWKGYTPGYWDYEFASIEAPYHKARLLRNITDPEPGLKWHSITPLILTVQHFIAFASNNYVKDPYQEKKKEKPTHYRHVLLSELFAALCPKQVKEKFLLPLLTGLYSNEERKTYKVLTTADVYVPCSTHYTYHHLLLEVLSFLINIGATEVYIGNLLPTSDAEAAYSLRIIEQSFERAVFQFQTEVRAAIKNPRKASDGKSTYCFRVHTKEDPYRYCQFNRLRAFLNHTLSRADANSTFLDERYNTPNTVLDPSKPYRNPFLDIWYNNL